MEDKLNELKELVKNENWLQFDLNGTCLCRSAISGQTGGGLFSVYPRLQWRQVSPAALPIYQLAERRSPQPQWRPAKVQRWTPEEGTTSERGWKG
eukprot:3410386-Amphidinium_carterae.1